MNPFLFAIFFELVSGISGAALPERDVAPLPHPSHPFVARDASPPLYYSIERGGALYARPDRAAPAPDFRPLALQEPLFRLDAQDGWLQVRTMEGVTGFVPEESVSNVWLRISKKRQMLFAYRGAELAARIPVDLGLNAIMDKERRGGVLEPDHWRTPEGNFRIVAKNPDSKYRKALLLNYPSAEDAERGVEAGLIADAEYRAIMKAEETGGIPPMDTLLGGFIEIHGNGTGAGVNWTEGCIAVTDWWIDQLWEMAHVGTPVLVE